MRVDRTKLISGMHAWLALVLLTAGCASQVPAPTSPAAVAQADRQRRSDFDRSLDRWQGAPLSELLSKLGKPGAVTPGPDGKTLYAFTRAMPTDPGTGRSRFSCTVRFVVDAQSQRVQGHRIDGC